MESEQPPPPAQFELANLPRGLFPTLLAQFHLVKNPTQAVFLSAVLFTAATWIPLLVICLQQGTAFEGLVQLPLLADYISAGRFLLVAPLLILSDITTKPWLLKVATHLLQEHVQPADIPHFNKMTRRIFSLRDAVSIQLIVLLIALATSPLWVKLVLSVQFTNWQMVPGANPASLSAAGMWHAYVSQPLFRFVLIDWLLDYALWAFFLFKTSRFPLRINATHPDGVGGLSFIAVGQSLFGIAVFALSTALCTVVAQTILETHAKLQSFTNVGILFIAAMLVLFLGPLLVFTPLLINAKRQAVFSYGAVCHQLNDAFASTWIGARLTATPAFTASQEPSTLADMNACFQNVQNMRVFVFGKQSIITFAVVAAIPAIPLVLTAVPIDQLVKQLLKALT